VYVASIPSSRFDMTRERMKICSLLWAAGISAEMSFSIEPKLAKQVTAALEGNVPFVVVIGEDELDKGLVQLKDMHARSAELVPINSLVSALCNAGASVIGITGHATKINASGTFSLDNKTSSDSSADKNSVSSVPKNTGSVGVSIEGTDRLYGRFMRPTEQIF
jgi:Anticodon binding domain